VAGEDKGNHMTTRAEQFLEGFKLGKLGAGKINFDRQNVPNDADISFQPQVPRLEKIRIVHEIKSSSMTPDPLIIWEDLDRLLYMLELTADKSTGKVSPLSDVWYLQISCGKPENPGGHAVKQDWGIVSRKTTVKKLKEKYAKYLVVIKEKGIDGLISSKVVETFFQPLPSDKSFFYRWLLKKEHGEL
jgi:hypothetical protein